MWRKFILFCCFVVAIGSAVQAGMYVWNGSAGDGLWETAANWTVTDSLWTWPNQETGAEYINSDALTIDILNGGVVARADTLRIKGADELTAAVLKLDGASSLSVNGRLSIGTDPNDLARRGELNILGGSTLTILDGPNGNDLYVADDANTVGTVNVVDSILNIFDDITIDEGEGHVTISGSSTITADDIIAGNSAGGVGDVNISGTTTVSLDDLKTNTGQGHITIAGSAVLTLDDLMIDDPNGAGTIDIGEAATVTVADDVTIDEAAGTINIGGTATVSNGDDFSVGDDGPSVGTVNIGGNATVTVGDILYVAHNEGAEGHLNISDNAKVEILDDLIISNAAGIKGTLHISGNPTINIASEFYMNDDSSDPMVPSTSEAIMDGGTVNVASNSNLNDDNNGTATFTMNGGRWYCGGYLNLSDNLDGTAHLTMNGGEMIAGGDLRLGKDGGEDTGQVRIFLNGGLLQAEGLDIKITDTQIIHTNGDLRLSSASVSEDDIRQLIAGGKIVVTGEESVNYFIFTAGGYTVLSGPPVKAWKPDPADGAKGVSYIPPIVTYVSTDVPKPVSDRNFIPPNTTVWGQGVSTLSVPDSFKIKDINIELDMTVSGQNADYNVYVKDPGGKEVELFTDVGAGSGFKNTILDDEASSTIGGKRDPFTGRFKPEGKLSDLDGRNAQGNWQLKIIDDWYGSSATLNWWRIVVVKPLLINWTPASNAASQKVYFADNFEDVNSSAGKALKGSLAGNVSSLDIGSFALDQTYYWRVDAVDPNGNPMPAGDIWSFTTSSGNAEIEIRTAHANDDGEDHIAYGTEADDGAESRSSTDLEMPWEGAVGASSYQVIGLRFPKIPLGKDADVIDATVQLTADNDDDEKLIGGPVNLIINGLLQADPGRLTSGENFYTDRNPKTAAEVPWTEIPDWTNGEATAASKTPNISSLILEIITQDGWAEGNDLMLFLRDDETKPSAATRSALSFDAGAGVAPLLKMTLGKSEVAGSPSPADKAVDVPLETILSWQPGFSAVARNVYFGTDAASPALVGMTTGFTSAPKLNPSTTYYWKIEEIEANGAKHAGGVWSFTTVPAEATVPSPADGATNVAPDVVLSWKAGVKAVSHDVYFGMASPPPFIGNQAESSYNPGGLRLTGTFYWQIDEIDADGTKHIGAVWSFSTLSGQASTPDPADGALIEQTYALLGWTAGQTAVSHNVYISNNLDDVTTGAAAAFAGNVTTTNLSVGVPGTPVPDGLVPGSTYYWRVDELEADPNVVHEGVVWSFSVLPDKAHNPSPADAATGVATNAQLSWSAGLGAKLHSVYFGDNADTVANAVGAPPLPMTTKDPGPLEPGKTYYWRVDEFNPPTTVKGDVWSFTTAP